ncbi:ferritin-like domain-containing protein [Nitratifractor salsuginis]|uniref:DUF455 domain-containing protein n=1 Tax=Nitratifractor salsuginis (strain DSM 16511 / JCM 12458 / E9I37-1) TaxID=749222 RepID=E6X075_NITSE|nr:ferritin-like domain-containing protein [Nitratifractor salsuginis]ADV45664.1 protein of unknown function DUF455 [Nitratifractor salsuginis DSM 16511]
MTFYSLAEKALQSADIDEKASAISRLMRYCSTGDDRPESGFAPWSFEAPSYASRCRIVDPRELPRRRSFDTPKGLAILLHAIAHIEYSAVDLALDAVYRFPAMPTAFRRDWLEVAEDEVRHFRMLEAILEELGYRYGDFPVHRGLFDAAKHTEGDILHRMAVIPRHYEATGLDVNPRIMEKLRPFAHKEAVATTIEALETIYREEIDHVRKGDRWFRYCCEQRGLESERTFREILDRYDLRKRQGNFLNVPARKAAGFTCAELKDLGAAECED